MSSPHLRRRYRAAGTRPGLAYLFLLLAGATLYVGLRVYTIREQRDGTAEGELRSRLCALIFLVGQLPTDPGSDTGVRATVETLTDLLVDDLRAGGASLRARIPVLLEGMVEGGKLM